MHSAHWDFVIDIHSPVCLVCCLLLGLSNVCSDFLCAPMSKGCAGGSADPARHHGLLRSYSSMCSVCPSWVSTLLAPPAEATLLCFVLSDFGPACFEGVAPAVLPTVYSTVCGSELCVCVCILPCRVLMDLILW